MKKAQKRKSKKRKKSFFGAFKGIGSFTEEDEKWMEGKEHF